MPKKIYRGFRAWKMESERERVAEDMVKKKVRRVVSGRKRMDKGVRRSVVGDIGGDASGGVTRSWGAGRALLG